MLSPSGTWAPLALLILGVKETLGNVYRSHSSFVNETTIHSSVWNNNVTFFDTTTIPVTQFVDVTVSYYVNTTISCTETSTVLTNITESTTTTLHYTVSITQTDLATVTNTQTTTATVPATITAYTTQTITSTTVDPCPTTCSLSAGTVNLFFWPTDRPYSYPSTYVDTALTYTFTWPSVYMLIPTIRGTNSLGPTGPTTSNWILALDLEEVSTIVDGTATTQLTLSDLGTDCPQTAAPSAIATMVDPRCDPILAAPRQVSSWANPCNACGRFGLFDPPYAVPTITGGLIETTTPVPVTTTAAPTPIPTPVGVLLIVYYVDGKAMTTATIPTSGISGTVMSSIAVSLTGTTSSSSAIVSTSSSTLTTSSSSLTITRTASPSTSLSASPSTAPLTTPPSSSLTKPSSSLNPSPTPSVVTALATRVTGGLAWLISSITIAVFLI